MVLSGLPNKIADGSYRLEFKRPAGKLDRRQLLGMALPRRRELPVIDTDRCRGADCALCQPVCPAGAVTLSGPRAMIDSDACRGCGTCQTVCPENAVIFEAGDAAMLDGRMRDMLAAAEGNTVIALLCRDCTPQDLSLPPQVKPLALPCLAAATPRLLLQALRLGAGAVAILSGESCRAENPAARWQNGVGFVRELLAAWGINPERIGTFTCDDATPEVFSKEMAGFAERVKHWGATGLHDAAAAADGASLKLRDMIVETNRERKSGAVISGPGTPFGQVAIDAARCTACSLCAANCPAGAIFTAAGDEGGILLYFQAASCIACGRCAEICPEGCLAVTPELDLKRLDEPAVKLFEDDMARCSVCGRPVAPRAMIARIRTKLEADGITNISHLELCPDCKTAAGLRKNRNLAGRPSEVN